ncbi:unnamed protein product [Calypogeia fissa]
MAGAMPLSPTSKIGSQELPFKPRNGAEFLRVFHSPLLHGAPIVSQVSFVLPRLDFSSHGRSSIQRLSSGLGFNYGSGGEGDGYGSVALQQGSRDGVFDILARDVEVVREDTGRVEEMSKRLGFNDGNGGVVMVKNGTNWGETAQQPAEIRHPRAEGAFQTLAGDGEFMKKSLTWAVKNLQKLPCTKEEVKKRLSKLALKSAKEVRLGSEFQSTKTSVLKVVKEGARVLTLVKEGLVQASEPVVEWAEIVAGRTGVNKIVQKDAEFLKEGVNLVQEELKEVIRLRLWEEEVIAGETTSSWPEPAYSDLSGRDLLAADMEAIESYENYFRGLLSTWRIPLRQSYDPEAVASYFNRRPHLLLFRLLQVSAALSGIALQLFLDKVGVQLGWIGENEGSPSALKNAEALKQTLLRLGPTFIKVGQSISSRPDLIGIETAKVLSELQDRLPPFPTEEAMAVIELDLGVPASEVFSCLSTDPVAAASFGQVYRGQTMDGEEVAVKVQRPGLLFDVALDIYVLRLGLGILRKWAKMNSDISVLADELGYGLFGELDYTLEAANATEFGESVKHLSYVKVPRTLPHLTTKRVLTMEWITGFRPLDLQLIAKGNDLTGDLAGIDSQEAKLYLDDVVKKGVECSLVQLLETGVMHADPHPGNLLYMKDGSLVYLDFGLLARVTKKHRSAMLAVIAHLVNAEWQCLANDFSDLDILKPSTDRFALRLALERAFGEGPDAVVKDGVPDIQFGQVTGKLWKIALKFRFRLPPYYTLVLRALASLEGIAVSVDPNYKVFAAAYPYVVRHLLSDNSRPSRQVLQSLVLTQKREFRWGRITDIMATSRGGAQHSVMQRSGQSVAAYLPGGGAQVRNVPDRDAMTSMLLAFSLSREGTSVRRVLWEADTKSLAKGFISPFAGFLRRKVALAIAQTFYLSMLSFKQVGTKWASMSTSAGYGPGRNMDSLELTRSEVLHSEVQPVLNSENWYLVESRMNNRRLWFLLKVLAGRLRSSPILMLRVSWSFFTMVAFAAAVALHKYCVALSDRLLSATTNRILDVTPSPADQYASPQLQGDSVQ